MRTFSLRSFSPFMLAVCILPVVILGYCRHYYTDSSTFAWNCTFFLPLWMLYWPKLNFYDGPLWFSGRKCNILLPQFTFMDRHCTFLVVGILSAYALRSCGWWCYHKMGAILSLWIRGIRRMFAWQKGSCKFQLRWFCMRK